MTTDVADTEILPEEQAAPALNDEVALDTEDLAEAPESDSQEAVEEEAPPPVVVPPTPRTPQEIQAAIDAGEVPTTEEKARLRSHIQAEQNKALAQHQARQQAQKRQHDLTNLHQEFPKKLADKVTKLAEEGQFIPRLVEVEIKEAAQELLRESEDLVLMPYVADLRVKAYQLVAQHAPQNAQAAWDWMEGKGLVELQAAYAKWNEEAGARVSVDGTKLSTLEQENATLKAEVERLTSARGKGTVTTQGKESVKDTRSEDEILLDPRTDMKTIDKILAKRG